MKPIRFFAVLLTVMFLADQLCGQVVLFRDDFSDELSSDWIDSLGHLGSRAIVDGYYVLSPDLPDRPMAPMLDGMPDDVSIRSSVKLVGDKPSSGFIAAGVGARSNVFDEIHSDVWGQLSSGGIHGLGWKREAVVIENHDFDLFNDEIEFRLDVSGDFHAFTAWEQNSEMPSEPSAVWTTPAVSGEHIWITFNNANVPESQLISAAFGYFEVIGLSPCNLNREVACDISDLDALVGAGDLTDGFEVSAGKIVRYDLDQNGVVDTNDLDKWLSDAATENGLAGTYLKGDSNLDGMVDSADLNAVALSWKQDGKTWSQGDFDGDGKVGSSDLNQLALNWNQSVATAAPVPEPSSHATFVLAVTALFSFVRKK